MTAWLYMLYYLEICCRHAEKTWSSNIRRFITITSRSTTRDSITPAQSLIRLIGVNRPADLYTDSATLVGVRCSLLQTTSRAHVIRQLCHWRRGLYRVGQKVGPLLWKANILCLHLQNASSSFYDFWHTSTPFYSEYSPICLFKIYQIY